MKVTGTPNAHYHNGFAIVRCTHRREAVWVAYAKVAILSLTGHGATLVGGAS
jgi:hypothetical protein